MFVWLWLWAFPLFPSFASTVSSPPARRRLIHVPDCCRARRTTTTTTIAVFLCAHQWPTKQWEERWNTYCAETGDKAWAMTKDCGVAWPGTVATALADCRGIADECVRHFLSVSFAHAWQRRRSVSILSFWLGKAH